MRDLCGWRPLEAIGRQPDLMCRRPCVQHFVMMVAGASTQIHRCPGHKMAEVFVEKLKLGEQP